MKFTGIVDKEMQAKLEEIHRAVLPIAVQYRIGTDGNKALVEALSRLTVELSGRLATTAGNAQANRLTTRRPIVKINYRLFKLNDADMKDTYLHELAHIVANYAYQGSMGHNSRWKHAAQALGARPERCHKLDVTHLERKKGKRYAWVCGCQTFQLTRLKHMRGLASEVLGRPRYNCRKCKAYLKPTMEAVGGKPVSEQAHAVAA